MNEERFFHLATFVRILYQKGLFDLPMPFRKRPSRRAALPLRLFIFVFVLSSTFSLSPAPSMGQTGLAGWWKFDEGSGSSAADASGNGNTGTLVNGPTWTTGKIGQALNFDGVNDYVTLGNPASLQLTGAITVSAWVYHDAFVHAANTIASKQGGSTNRGWKLGANNGAGSAYCFDIAPTNSTLLGACGPGNSNTTGEWVHVVGVYDPSNAIIVYKNGAQIGIQTSGVPASQFSSSRPVEIGTRSDVTDHWFDGKIDDVRIYNLALSASEIQALYNDGA
jgi:hypothetical protein